MPSKHRYRAVVVRPETELAERARVAVAAVDSNLNAHVSAFLRWLVGDTDDLPARPPVAATTDHPGSTTEPDGH